MDSTMMIAIAIVTGIAAVAALTVKRWLEQRRLEQKREAVLHMDVINRAGNAGDALCPWLSTDGLKLLGNIIEQHNQGINRNVVSLTPRTERAITLGQEWQHSVSAPTPTAIPSQMQLAKELRATLMDYLQLVKEAHHDKIIATGLARERVREATLLNARICIATYQTRAKAALAQDAPNQALHFLKRAEKTIRDLKELPADLTEELNLLTGAINELEARRAEDTSHSRLADGADELAEADESWKKKHYD